MPIHYYDVEVRSRLAQKRKLNTYLKGLFTQYRPVKQIELSYIFCNDLYLLEKNIQFLDHDTLTDILTFDLSESDDALVGEIYISKERVEENAQRFGSDYLTELHRIIFHGALHLCGFKDKTKKDKALMTEMEDRCINEYFEGHEV